MFTLIGAFLFSYLIGGPGKGAFWFSLALLFSGLLTIILTRVTLGTLSRLGPKLISKCTNKENGVKFIYGMGATLACFQIASLTLLHFILTIIYQSLFFDKKTPIEYEQLFMVLLGYVFGILICLIYYREVGSLLAKGVAVGTEFVN